MSGAPARQQKVTVRRETWLKVFLGALWLVCLYRAITQSIVHDEALTFGLYIQAPAAQIFRFFDANHHFLNTLLMKLSVSLFGLSEWSMRLPALLGAALYFAGVYRICAREFKRNSACADAAALLSLNPIVLDFMVAARGYGMALACLMWALAILLEFLRDSADAKPRELVQAGGALALSVMANLVFVIPAFALGGIVWLVLKREAARDIPGEAEAGKPKRSKKKSKAAPPAARLALRAFWLWVALPAACGLALFLIVSPLAEAKPGDLYAGASTIAESLRSLYNGSLAHGGVLRDAAQQAVWRDAMAFALAPAILLGSLAMGIRARNFLLILVSGTAVASAAGLLVLHLAVNLLYPLDRTGIYFLPLAALALASLADATVEAPWSKPAQIGAYAIAAILAAQFLLEFDTRKFMVWEYDADTRSILAELAKRAPKPQTASIRLGNSWQLEPSLNFYGLKDNLTWLQPVTRAPIGPGADYYVLMAADRDAIDRLHLKVLYTGPSSGTVLAAPQ